MHFSLAEQLKTATRALHVEVERSALMRRLLAGRLERRGYLALLANLAALYDSLEPLLARHAEHPWLAALPLTELRRGPALHADLACIGGSAPLPAIVDATDDYRTRLEELGRDAPGLLLAHAYVRYLGDLSGGQLLKSIVGRAYGLDAAQGLRFYDFGDAATAGALMRRFRAALDSVDDPATQQQLVAEAEQAFRLHARLFDQLFEQLSGQKAGAAPQAASASALG